MGSSLPGFSPINHKGLSRSTYYVSQMLGFPTPPSFVSTGHFVSNLQHFPNPLPPSGDWQTQNQKPIFILFRLKVKVTLFLGADHKWCTQCPNHTDLHAANHQCWFVMQSDWPTPNQLRQPAFSGWHLLPNIFSCMFRNIYSYNVLVFTSD